MYRPRVLISLLLLPLLASCATVRVGQDFDLAAFDAKVVRGVTTQAEVRGWLGAPAGFGVSVEASGERYEEWNYYYGSVRIPRAKDTDVKVLQIKFDERGVVRAYNWSGQRG